MTDLELPVMDEERVIDRITSFINSRIDSFGYDGAVVGISGGVDSALTALLAQRAFEESHNYRSVHCVSLPALENDNRYAVKFLEEVVDDKDFMTSETKSINKVRNTIANLVEPPEISKFDRGNMTARARANVLNTISARQNKILLGTGNKDESSLGYFTLFGDAAVHALPIGELPKRLVWDLAEYMGVPDEIVNRPPTDGLQKDKTDEGELGFTYEEAEKVIEAVNQGLNPSALDLDISEDKIEKIWNRIQIGRDKLEIINPPVANLNLDYEPIE